jgi:hypothetical protein
MHNPTYTHYTRSAQNPPHMGVSQIKKICTAVFYTLLYRFCNTVLLTEHVHLTLFTAKLVCMTQLLAFTHSHRNTLIPLAVISLLLLALLITA